MNSRQYTDEDCLRVLQNLSEYQNSSLPAREMLEVEAHLTQCAECARAAHEQDQIVGLLREAPRQETSNDFMAKLHSRLDTIEAERPAARVGFRDRIQQWLGLSPMYRLPALGVGLAACAAALFFVYGRPAEPVIAPSAVPIAQERESLQRHVAIAAENPFADPAAANLEAHSSLNETQQDGQEADS